MTSTPLLNATVSILLLQFGSRLLSFVLNQFLLRFSSPAALGVSTLGFDVVRDTSLFIARDGLRGAVLRSRSLPSSVRSLPSKLALLPVVLFGLWQMTVPKASQMEGFVSALLLYITSAVLEMLAERWYLETLVDWERLTTKRVRIEGLAIAAKTTATLMWLVMMTSRPAIEAYGVGQVAYSIVLVVGLQRVARGATSKPAQVADKEVISTAWALTRQGVVKQFLTEGDKIIAGRLGKVEDQGAYAVALNYGSLAARLLFQPIEESSRLTFSTASTTVEGLTSSLTLLQDLCLFQTHLSLVLVCFAPPYVGPVIHILLGRRWSETSAPAILRTYCYYLPFIAINGITEAFFQSTATGSWLYFGSAWLVACSVGFLATVYVTQQAGMGEHGLIIANCVNMTMRIVFALVYVHQLVRTRPAKDDTEREKLVKAWSVRRCLPSPLTVIAFLAGGYMVRRSERSSSLDKRDMMTHFAIGGFLGAACLLIAVYSQRHVIRRTRAKLKKA